MKKFILALMGMIIGLTATSAMGAALGVAVGATPAAGALALDSLAVGVSCMGGLAPTGALRAGLYSEAWTGELVKAFRAAAEAVGWYNKIRSYDQYVQNDVIHLVDIGADPEVLVNNTTYPLEIENLEDGDIAVTLDKYQTKPTRVTDDELHALTYDKMASVVDRHKEAFSETKFSRAIHSVAPAEHTDKTPVILTSGEVADDRKRLTRSDIIALKKAFDKAKVPAEGRILVLCADMWPTFWNRIRNSRPNTTTMRAAQSLAFMASRSTSSTSVHTTTPLPGRNLRMVLSPPLPTDSAAWHTRPSA